MNFEDLDHDARGCIARSLSNDDDHISLFSLSLVAKDFVNLRSLIPVDTPLERSIGRFGYLRLLDWYLGWSKNPQLKIVYGRALYYDQRSMLSLFDYQKRRLTYRPKGICQMVENEIDFVIGVSGRIDLMERWMDLGYDGVLGGIYYRDDMKARDDYSTKRNEPYHYFQEAFEYALLYGSVKIMKSLLQVFSVKVDDRLGFSRINTQEMLSLLIPNPKDNIEAFITIAFRSHNYGLLKYLVAKVGEEEVFSLITEEKLIGWLDDLSINRHHTEVFPDLNKNYLDLVKEDTSKFAEYIWQRLYHRVSNHKAIFEILINQYNWEIVEPFVTRMIVTNGELNAVDCLSLFFFDLYNSVKLFLEKGVILPNGLSFSALVTSLESNGELSRCPWCAQLDVCLCSKQKKDIVFNRWRDRIAIPLFKRWYGATIPDESYYRFLVRKK